MADSAADKAIEQGATQHKAEVTAFKYDVAKTQGVDKAQQTA